LHLTLHSDYALRILMYLTVRNSEPVTIKEISTAYGISQHHVTKVVNRLVKYQLITSIRGRRGGLRLAQSPDQIKLGAVVRRTEASFHIAECFDELTNTCPITPACELRVVLGKARDAFLAVLDQTTLRDLVVHKRNLLQLLGDQQNR